MRPAHLQQRAPWSSLVTPGIAPSHGRGAWGPCPTCPLRAWTESRAGSWQSRMRLGRCSHIPSLVCAPAHSASAAREHSEPLWGHGSDCLPHPHP